MKINSARKEWVDCFNSEVTPIESGYANENECMPLGNAETWLYSLPDLHSSELIKVTYACTCSYTRFEGI